MHIKIPRLALFALLALLSALAYQAYWMSAYYRNQSERLRLDVLSAMRAADDRLIYQQRTQAGFFKYKTEDLPVYNDLLLAELAARDLSLDSYVEMAMSNGKVLSRVPVQADTSGSFTSYDYPLDMEGNVVLRLFLKNPDLYLARQMSGLLLVSFLLILMLLVSYIYLFRIIYKQKTLDEIKTDFVNNMTHELKTPLSIVYAANDALLNYGMGDKPERRETYLKTSQEQLLHLNRLIEQILTLSVEERKNLRLNPEEIPLNEFFLHLRHQYRVQAVKDVKIEVAVDPESLVLKADPVHFRNLVCNLIDNSIKYSGPEVTIRLQASERNGRVEIRVSDTGNGIPADALPHLFERFYRVSSGDRHDVKGYGLGLHYVKTIVDKQGWKIEVKSRLGRGSEFRIEANDKVEKQGSFDSL